MPAFDIGLNRDGGLTHVLDKGLGPRGWETGELRELVHQALE